MFGQTLLLQRQTEEGREAARLQVVLDSKGAENKMISLSVHQRQKDREEREQG